MFHPVRRQAIAGLRYRQGLCLLRPGRGHDCARLCQELAERRINLVMAAGSGQAGLPGDMWLCLPEEHLGRAWPLAREWEDGGEGQPEVPEVIAPVALLTIYPLGPGLSLCGRVMVGLARAGLTWLAWGSSLSALVVALRQEDLPRALPALQEMLELPSGLAPSHQPGQTVSVTKRPRS